LEFFWALRFFEQVFVVGVALIGVDGRAFGQVQEIRETAERELEALRTQRERVKQLEQDKDELEQLERTDDLA
jgi:cell shape-determining protein MreC